MRSSSSAVRRSPSQGSTLPPAAWASSARRVTNSLAASWWASLLELASASAAEACQRSSERSRPSSAATTSAPASSSTPAPGLRALSPPLFRVGDGSSAGAAREPVADDPSTRERSISTPKPNIRIPEEEAKPQLGAPPGDAERVVADARLGGDPRQRHGLDSRPQDQHRLLARERPGPHGTRQNQFLLLHRFRGCGVRRGDVGILRPQASLLAQLGERGVRRVEEQVRCDPARPFLERVAPDRSPEMREQKRPELLPLTDLKQQPAGEPLQAGQKRLQHNPRRELIRPRLPEQRRQDRVFGVVVAAQASERAEKLLHGRERGERRLTLRPQAEPAAERFRGERVPLVLERDDNVEPGGTLAAETSFGATGHETPMGRLHEPARWRPRLTG